MMRRAIGAGLADPASVERSGNRLDHRDFERFLRRERRQNARKAAGHQRLAGAGRANHQEIMPAGRGDLQCALRRLLPFDLRKVRAMGRRLGLGERGARQDRAPFR